MWPSNFTPKYVPQRIENKALITCSSMTIAAFTIHNIQKVEPTQKSINRWLDKQIMIYAHNGVLLSHKKEGSTDNCYNVNEPQKHVKWRKVHILYDSFFNHYPRICFLLVLEKGGEAEKPPSIASSTRLDPEPNLHLRYVPWLGIEPVHFGVQDDVSTNQGRTTFMFSLRIDCVWHCDKLLITLWIIFYYPHFPNSGAKGCIS